MQVFQEKHSLSVTKFSWCGCAFLGSWYVVRGPLGIQEPPVNVYRHIGDSGHYYKAMADVKHETSLNMFYEALKHLIVFDFQVPALSSQGQGWHFTQWAVRARAVGCEDRASHSPGWQTVVLQGWESWGAWGSCAIRGMFLSSAAILLMYPQCW